MPIIRKLSLFLCFVVLFVACNNNKTPVLPEDPIPIQDSTSVEIIPEKKEIIVAAARTDEYFKILKGKNIALLVNQTSMVDSSHLVDLLNENKFNIKRIFAPEHGFRGKADAGEKIKNGKDSKTGIPIISLYGKRKKPLPADLKGIDLVVFDIQDVGARFYTYISTMHYVMEACAENGVEFLILDRPNPNGHYVDGPIRAQAQKSFVGMHPIPIVHGMTVGELAQMILGEGWLKGHPNLDLKIVKCKNYDHETFYELPVKPSPNLPNSRSIYLYPSLCLFEGTDISVGRGTDKQFQIYGAPLSSIGDYEFSPEPKEGAKHPKHNGKRSKGFDLSQIPLEDLQSQKQLNLTYLLDMYKAYPRKSSFFNKNKFFDKLSGTRTLRKQIQAGKSEATIRASWEKGLEEFKNSRSQYLLY